MKNFNDKKYYSTFLLICFLLIIFALLKKNYLYKYYLKENFINIPNPYNEIKDMLSLSDFDYNKEIFTKKTKKFSKKGWKETTKKEDNVIGKGVKKGWKETTKKKKRRRRREKKRSSNERNINEIESIVNQQVKTAISAINMPQGTQGPQGKEGPSGGIYQHNGYLTSNSNINNMIPKQMITALKPIGNIGSPVIFSDSDYNSDRKWMMNADGTITNQYLGKKYCLSLNQDNSTQAGKYSLLELVNKDNGSCTQFYEDNNSRIKIKDTNNCMTVKNTSSMKGLNLSIPNTKKCSFSEIVNSDCKIDDNTQVLGIDTCNNIVKSDQTFVWL